MGYKKESKKGRKKNIEYRENNSTVELNPTVSIIKLSINGLSTPVKMHRLTDGIKKQELTMYCLKET